MASTPPLRVMLVDDHEVVRDGIKALLAPNDDIVVCAEAATVRQAVAEADRALPDVIVMDVRLQDGSGIEATRDIRAARPQTQVLMLTSFADDQALFASILAGAAGYVLKQIRGDDLVRAIRTVGAGVSLLDPAVTKGVLDRLRKGKHLLKDERLARLSPQEERILELVSTGRTNKEIGEEFHLAEKTVKNYVSSILAKLEVTRRAEAAPTSPATPPLPAHNAWPSDCRRRLRGGVPVGVGQWSRSTPAVRLYRHRQGATTTRGEGIAPLSEQVRRRGHGNHPWNRWARADGQGSRDPEPPPGGWSGGRRGPQWTPGVLLRARAGRHRLERSRQRGHRLSDRVDHQDLHGDRRAAVVGAGVGRSRRSCQRLSARVQTGSRERRAPGGDGATAADPHGRAPPARVSLTGHQADLGRP